MNELALFAGAGGGILGGILLGWRTVCAVEIDPYAAGILAQRQNDGCLHPFPIWDDIRTFNGRPWRGVVDVVSGGFPCQDISAAGKGAGITGSRSGLWREMARIIGEVRPRYALVENSPVLTSRGLGTVLGDLAEMGYDAKWGVLGAEDAIWLAGDPCVDHERARIFVLASCDTVRSGWSARRTRGPDHSRPSECDGPGEVRKNPRSDSNRTGCTRTGSPQPGGRIDDAEPSWILQEVPNTDSPGLPKSRGSSEAPSADGGAITTTHRGHWWAVEPNLGRVAHGVADRVDRLKCLGNGQVPAVVKLAWETLTQ